MSSTISSPRHPAKLDRIIIEETRATFSHAASDGHALIVADMKEALKLAALIKDGGDDAKEFWAVFEGRTTKGFNPLEHLQKVGVVNQTTMIATETQEIADIVKDAVGEAGFANTKDTLCYATNDNQRATMGALEAGEADLAIVVGGYNSSNTSHIVELCEERMPTFFVRNELEWEDDGSLNHFNIHTQEMERSTGFLPEQPTILITSGASSPDASMESRNLPNCSSDASFSDSSSCMRVISPRAFLNSSCKDT